MRVCILDIICVYGCIGTLLVVHVGMRACLRLINTTRTHALMCVISLTRDCTAGHLSISMLLSFGSICINYILTDLNNCYIFLTVQL